MGTMGVRAVLAGAFLATAGALGGVQAWPGSSSVIAEPTLAVPNLHVAETAPGPGWLAGFLVRSCEHSLAATRRDQASARERRRECERDHKVARDDRN